MVVLLKRRHLNRRTVLRGMGSIAVGLPLLEAMGCVNDDGSPVSSARSALAGGTPPVSADMPLQRFMSTAIPNGVVPLEWFPEGGISDFETKKIMDPLPEHGLPGLADHRDDLVIFKGLWHKAASLGPTASHNEGHACTLTGSAMQGPPGVQDFSQWTMVGPSLDQYLAGRLEERAGSPFGRKSIAIASTAQFNRTVSYDATGTAIPVHSTVNSLFDDLFGLAELSAAERDALRARRHSALDSTMASYQRLKARIGAPDKARVEEHLDALRQVELRLDTEIVCDAPDPLTFPEPSGGQYGENMPQWVDLMQDLVVLAFSCDITRVAAMSYRPCGGGSSYLPWLGFDPEDYGTGEHHEMSHRYLDPVWDPALVLAAQWFSGLTAQMISKLKATPEAGGTLFDSVALLQSSEMANGHHDMEDMPYVLAGSAGGVIETGRYLQFPELTPTNPLLVSILQAFGFDDTSFGDAEPNSGPLPGLLG